MRLPKILNLALVAAAAGAALPVAAQAKMEVAMQDDLVIVDQYSNRDTALAQFKAMGGTNVRITIPHPESGALKNSTAATAVGSRTLGAYDSAVDAVIGAGLTPQLTLFWRSANAKLQAAWMKNVVTHYGSKVNRYSISNEPDLYMTEDTSCTKTVIKGLEKKFKKDFVKQGGTLRAKVATSTKGSPVKDACLRYERGVTYNKIAKPAAKAIRQANSNAQVLGGETSPNKGLDWFIKAAKPKTLGVDGWAHHPFQFQNTTPSKPTQVWGIARMKQFKKLVGLPIYVTEFGYPNPGSPMDDHYYNGTLTDAKVTKALVAAWKLAKKDGMKQMFQFQWYNPPAFRKDIFNTALLDSDTGALTPEYNALSALIHSF
jgi:hypothetical protein